MDEDGPLFKRILQIMPASGWRAVQERPNETSGRVEYSTVPLVCWALVEHDEGDQEIMGFASGEGFVIPVNGLHGFRTYQHGEDRDTEGAT